MREKNYPKVRITVEALREDGTAEDSLTLEEGGAVITSFDKNNELMTTTNVVGKVSAGGFAVSVGRVLSDIGMTNRYLKKFNALVHNAMYEIEKRRSKSEGESLSGGESENE